MMRTLVALAAVAAASAFAPGAMTGLRLKSAAAVSRRPATSPKMSLDAIEGAQQLLAVAQNVPFRRRGHRRAAGLHRTSQPLRLCDRPLGSFRPPGVVCGLQAGRLRHPLVVRCLAGC